MLTVLATLVAVAIAGGLRTAAIGLAFAVVVLTMLDGSPQPLALVVLAAVVVGRRFDARPCAGGAALTAAGVLVGGLVAARLPTPPTTAVLDVVVATLPIALLAVGWFDPRFAVAATVVLGWRLLAVDVPEILDVIGTVGQGADLQLAAARGLVMGAGPLADWQVSRSAVERCLR